MNTHLGWVTFVEELADQPASKVREAALLSGRRAAW